MSRDLRIRGYTVGQRPNAPLWVALAALIADLLLGGIAGDIARAVLYVSFAIWAYEELANGVNGFRRALGALGLLLVLVGLTRSIG